MATQFCITERTFVKHIKKKYNDLLIMNSEKQIKNILKEELGLLFDNLKSKMPDNYRKKRDNFLLSPLSESQKAFMTFVSSFESRLGNTMNIIARRIAILRYGVKCVPELVLSDGTPSTNMNYDGRKEQIIMTKIRIDDPRLKGEISRFIAEKARIKKDNKPCELNLSTLKDVHHCAQKYKGLTEQQKKTDLVIHKDRKWQIFEIKAGGVLDSTKGKGDIEKLLLEFVALNQINTEVYYSTLYTTEANKKIKGDEARYISADLIKIENDFWEMILPSDISFNKFKKIYIEALDEFKIQLQIEKMIEEIIS